MRRWVFRMSTEKPLVREWVREWVREREKEREKTHNTFVFCSVLKTFWIDKEGKNETYCWVRSLASKSTSSLSLALPFSHFLSLSLASFFSSEWPTETKIYVKLEFRTKPRKWLKAFGHKDIFMLVHKSIRFIKDQTLTMDFLPRPW